MEMYVDHQRHLVSIWLPNDEKDVAILEPVYRKYKGTPYRVAVFRSGKGNLLTNTAAMLKANRQEKRISIRYGGPPSWQVCRILV